MSFLQLLLSYFPCIAQKKSPPISTAASSSFASSRCCLSRSRSHFGLSQCASPSNKTRFGTSDPPVPFQSILRTLRLTFSCFHLVASIVYFPHRRIVRTSRVRIVVKVAYSPNLTFSRLNLASVCCFIVFSALVRSADYCVIVPACVGFDFAFVILFAANAMQWEHSNWSREHEATFASSLISRIQRSSPCIADLHHHHKRRKRLSHPK